ncbi:ATP-binding protein [Shewanella gelidimarina]|uniref:DEAD/DEAH box helicase n=1 Tax=Shewanella gelidimarina TaxID=56813 RepID=UPI00200EC4A8|nr:ATP-binding protein [Shewanella gelidimarina]MCL1058851.1 ATP-binding protein [Shewanella gelidimarina]
MSTAPWALGKLLKGNVDQLSKDDFDAEVQVFTDRLQQIHKLASNIKSETDASSAFTHFELFEILKLLSEWAGFVPDETRFALIVQLNKPPKDKPLASALALPHKTIEQFKRLPLLIKETDIEEDSPSSSSDSDTASLKNENDIPLLNSFFVNDIANAIKLVQTDKLSECSPLRAFLLATPSYQADLLHEAGENIVRHKLEIKNTPLGRWPDDPAHTMSLMQQFAINTLDEQLNLGGLYSVNGPPGTGKTTMLRDIIADNIVQRAKVLAGLKNAEAAFASSKKIKVGDKPVDVKVLIPALIGYEMVVVSSNNTAVENITKELPQTKALGSEFKELSYLKPVAQKVAATVNDKEKPKRLLALAEQDDCWGFIAAALGNSGNRKRFSSKVFFDKPQSMSTDEISSHYSTLVDAIKAIIKEGDPNKQFANAQLAYLKSEKAVKQALSDLQRLEALEAKKRKFETMRIAYLESELTYKRHMANLAKLKRKCLPWWHYKIVKGCRSRAICSAYSMLTEQKRLKSEKLKSLANLFETKLKRELNDCVLIVKVHHDVIFSQENESLDSDCIQRKAFGHSGKLNLLRSKLSASAFELHQAWLVASYDTSFKQTINQLPNLLQDKIALPADAKLMWQTLFMVCPVVSSAFASVANQFSSFGQGDIGWLFIDESGQATPPQAVGALLRAQKAVVVGDPLQIEPVFTTPPDIVEHLGRRLLQENWFDWSPSMISVQELADRVNPYGTSQIAVDKWLGSPLRVHRRCSDPMFSISNQIAYNNKMLHGLDKIAESAQFVWGPSCWFDISGSEDGKHYVPEQAEHVLNMIYEFVDEENDLPDCYIISPFSNVKVGVLDYLEQNFSHADVPSSKFTNWLKGRVGTVHTFQGKEEKLVIFVLGATESAGAAKWAASKPNLLNVAVTRAKKRVYIIGCYKQWSALPYFTDALGLLGKGLTVNH